MVSPLFIKRRGAPEHKFPQQLGTTPYPIGSFVSNANAPQLVDYGLVAGIGFFLASVVTPQGNAGAAEPRFDTHRASLVSAEAIKSRVFSPLTSGVVGGAPTAEYSWGSHAASLSSAEATKSQVFRSVAAPPVPKGTSAFIVGVPPTVDLTLQPTFQKSLVAGARPTASPTIIGGPQQVDLTQQAVFETSWYATKQGPVPPITQGAPQTDPSQLAAQVWQSVAAPSVASVPAAQYAWGGHSLALASAEAAKTTLFPSARTPTVASPISTFVVGAPQQQDLTLQAQFDSPGLLQGPVPPITVGTPQTDPSQLPAILWEPALPPTGGTLDSEYTWGTHAIALASAEALKSRIFTASTSALVVSPLAQFFTAAPQVDPTQLAAAFAFQPAAAPSAVSGVPAAQYIWGAHGIDLAAAEAAKSQFFESARAPVVASAAVKFLTAGPQFDPSQQQAELWASGLPQGLVSPFMGAATEITDVLSQASFGTPLILTPPPTGPVPPFTHRAAPQPDPTQLAASIFPAATPAPPIGKVPPFGFAWDLHAAQLAAAETAKSQFFQAIAIGGVTPTLTLEAPSLGGSKARKKIRGPYSDPAIYEAYIQRCIAEREKPRVNVETAILKEALVHEVEVRHQTNYAEYDALIRENQLLERLIKRETPKYVKAIAARQRQITQQIKDLEENEISSIIIFLDDM